MDPTPLPPPPDRSGITRRGLSRGALFAAAMLPVATACSARDAAAPAPDPNAGLVYTPERFMLGSDRGHGIAFQRMIDRMEADGGVVARLGPVRYDISDTPLTIHTAIQMIGAGFTEAGLEPDEPRARRGFTEAMRGTRIRSNHRGGPQITIAGGGARGAFFDRILFSQSHPAPGPGWAPTPYDYLFDIANTYGMVEFGTIGLLGINRAIRCNAGRMRYEHMYGQVFSAGLYLDDILDIPSFGFLRLYGFWSTDPSVRAWQMANLDVMTLGRCDGLFMDSLFAIDARHGIRLIDTGKGPATKLHIDAVYLDFTHTGMAVEAANVTLDVDSFQHTGEQAGGAPQPGSTGLRVTGGGGELDFGLFRSDRTAAGAIDCRANTTICIDRPRWHDLNGAAPIVNTGGVAILLGRREIGDASGRPLDEALVARQTNNRDFAIGQYPDDAAAARGGVAVGQVYVEARTQYLKRRAV